MRALLVTLALAGAIAAGCASARAQTIPDERYSVAMMSAADVIRALRCAPPFGCKRQRAKPQRAGEDFTFSLVFGGGLASRAGRYLGRNPTGWTRVWCGKFLRMIVPSDPGPSFDAARNWARYGRDAGGPAPGVIGVMPHHVGIVLGRCDDGSVLMRSGNHNRVVGDGCYPPQRFIAFRSA
jgi:uncharacterized protein YceK